jgi:hypothetical protein
MDTSLTEGDVTPFLTSANAFVTASLGSSLLSESILKEIERWITAHMIASTKERQAKEEEAGGAKIKYAGYWGAGLLGTSYGQMAVALDTTGVLLLVTEGRRFAWTKSIPQFEN